MKLIPKLKFHCDFNVRQKKNEFKSSNSDSHIVNLITMKLNHYDKVVKSIVVQGLLEIEKARWFHIKTLVLI